MPSVVYTHAHGKDELVAHRLPQESEIYALKFVEMVLPVPDHRIGAFSRLRHKYDSTTPVPSEDSQQSLGLVGSLGLVWMLLIAIGSMVGIESTGRWFGASDNSRSPRSSPSWLAHSVGSRQ